MKVRLGISSCLLGKKVRYDGRHKLDHYLKNTLGKYVKWVPVCPEVEMGLSVPREPMQLVGNPESPRLITVISCFDYTDHMIGWAISRLDELSKAGINGFIFKSRSPSCGLYDAEVFGKSGMLSQNGTGIFARELIRRFPMLPVEDEANLQDIRCRENFIECLFPTNG